MIGFEIEIVADDGHWWVKIDHHPHDMDKKIMWSVDVSREFDLGWRGGTAELTEEQPVNHPPNWTGPWIPWWWFWELSDCGKYKHMRNRVNCLFETRPARKSHGFARRSPTKHLVCHFVIVVGFLLGVMRYYKIDWPRSVLFRWRATSTPRDL